MGDIKYSTNLVRKFVEAQNKLCEDKIRFCVNSEEANAVKLENSKVVNDNFLRAIDDRIYALEEVNEVFSNLKIGIDMSDEEDYCYATVGLYTPEVDKLYIFYETMDPEKVKKIEHLKNILATIKED